MCFVYVCTRVRMKTIKYCNRETWCAVTCEANERSHLFFSCVIFTKFTLIFVQILMNFAFGYFCSPFQLILRYYLDVKTEVIAFLTLGTLSRRNHNSNWGVKGIGLPMFVSSWHLLVTFMNENDKFSWHEIHMKRTIFHYKGFPLNHIV